MRIQILTNILPDLSIEREKHGCFMFDFSKPYGDMMILGLNKIVIENMEINEIFSVITR